jgi:hypothetical protein
MKQAGKSKPSLVQGIKLAAPGLAVVALLAAMPGAWGPAYGQTTPVTDTGSSAPPSGGTTTTSPPPAPPAPPAQQTDPPPPPSPPPPPDSGTGTATGPDTGTLFGITGGTTNATTNTTDGASTQTEAATGDGARVTAVLNNTPAGTTLVVSIASGAQSPAATSQALAGAVNAIVQQVNQTLGAAIAGLVRSVLDPVVSQLQGGAQQATETAQTVLDQATAKIAAMVAQLQQMLSGGSPPATGPRTGITGVQTGELNSTQSPLSGQSIVVVRASVVQRPAPGQTGGAGGTTQPVVQLTIQLPSIFTQGTGGASGQASENSRRFAVVEMNDGPSAPAFVLPEPLRRVFQGVLLEPLLAGILPQTALGAVSAADCPPVQILEAAGIDTATGSISVTSRCRGLVNVLQLDRLPERPDYAIPGGHYFSQANGSPNSTPAFGYVVSDSGDIPMYREFERLGGVSQLGYPVASRAVKDGFVVQVTQKAILQWRPDQQQVWFANVFDEMSRAGLDLFLLQQHLIPPPQDLGDAALPDCVAGDTARCLDQVAENHWQLLEQAFVPPALRDAYWSDDDPLNHWGLPVAVEDFGPVVVMRAQRAAFQFWKEAQPFAAAGTVTIVNAGDISKEAGLWQRIVTMPVFAPLP